MAPFFVFLAGNKLPHLPIGIVRRPDRRPRKGQRFAQSVKAARRLITAKTAMKEGSCHL